MCKFALALHGLKKLKNKHASWVRLDIVASEKILGKKLKNKHASWVSLGSYVGSTEHDVQVRIGLAWASFAKLKSILRSPKPSKYLFFKAACVSILLYGCET